MTVPDALPPIPHGRQALFVTRVVMWDATAIVCEGRIPQGSPWVREGRCPSFVLLELAAQSAAVLDALQARAAPGRAAAADFAPGPGSIVRVRDLALGRAVIQPDHLFRARVTRGTAAPPLFLFTVRVDDEAGARS